MAGSLDTIAETYICAADSTDSIGNIRKLPYIIIIIIIKCCTCLVGCARKYPGLEGLLDTPGDNRPYVVGL